MPLTLDDATFATVDEALAVAEKRPISASAVAFVSLSDDVQLYVLETSAIAIRALDFAADWDTRPRAEWRLKQANIEHALSIAPSFKAGGSTADPLNTEGGSNGNVKRKEEVVGPIEEKIEYFAPTLLSAGSLDAFPQVVRTLLFPLLASTEAAGGSWGQADVVAVPA